MFHYGGRKMLMTGSRREELSVRRVRSLLAVAEHCSFSMAAQELGLTQPAVSQHVKQLEEQLGLDLLKRDKEGLRLSSGAAALLPAFRRFLSSNGAILDQLASLGQGAEQILRIASPASYAALFVVPVFQALRERFPNHILDISEIDDEESLRLVRDGDIDFGITSVFVPSPGLHFEALHQDFACVVMSEFNTLAKEAEIDDDAIVSQPMIRFPSGTHLTRLVVGHHGTNRGRTEDHCGGTATGNGLPYDPSELGCSCGSRRGCKSLRTSRPYYCSIE